jgi:hypothetical protein
VHGKEEEKLLREIVASPSAVLLLFSFSDVIRTHHRQSREPNHQAAINPGAVSTQTIRHHRRYSSRLEQGRGFVVRGQKQARGLWSLLVLCPRALGASQPLGECGDVTIFVDVGLGGQVLQVVIFTYSFSYNTDANNF